MKSAVSITSKTDRHVVTICVQGCYGYGSGGNDVASQIRAAIDAAIKEYPDFAFVIDLSQMEYEFGDAIAFVFHRYAERSLYFRLSSNHAAAWNGLLTMTMPDWGRHLGDRIIFV